MRVLGIDLAAQPRNTGVVRLDPVEGADDEREGRPPGRWVASVPDDVPTDEHLTDMATTVDVIGIDAPLGWPILFVEAVVAHENRERWPGTKHRRSLTHRRTDDEVRDRGWGRPMSASADLLGHVAMRCALLQRDFAEAWGTAAPRDGSGRLVETYPAAALRAWELQTAGYKGRSHDAGRGRIGILDALAAATADWLDSSAIRSACIDSDHTLDAFVSALNAVAAKVGATHGPESVEDHHCATLEGWIHVPIRPLSEIRPPVPEV